MTLVGGYKEIMWQKTQFVFPLLFPKENPEMLSWLGITTQKKKMPKSANLIKLCE
ncbi:rCG63472 [Rattus norvegicus]|uniref:RCG63472 n=1 Tax=Rattus norvegicus TaxID=10116 RepID=A6HI12_RAT|nr:rCG63472 [Rattus norvegicus]